MIFPTLKNKNCPHCQDFIDYLDKYRNHLIYYNYDSSINLDERTFKYIYSSGSKKVKFIWSESSFIDDENNEIINSVINDLQTSKIIMCNYYEKDNSPKLNFPNMIDCFIPKDEIFELEYLFKIKL